LTAEFRVVNVFVLFFFFLINNFIFKHSNIDNNIGSATIMLPRKVAAGTATEWKGKIDLSAGREMMMMIIIDLIMTTTLAVVFDFQAWFPGFQFLTRSSRRATACSATPVSSAGSDLSVSQIIHPATGLQAHPDS
jgi:hypothetical protein